MSCKLLKLVQFFTPNPYSQSDKRVGYVGDDAKMK